jgi:hypothetical protein
MKTKWFYFFVLTGTGSLFLGTPNSKAEVSVGVEISAAADFYEPLRPSGEWIEVGSYGRCWRPTIVEVGWKPYSDGHWVWTDCGWYWESDEPWAWACYHYGSWVVDSRYGWVWVPDIEWAPAWVSWRTGGGYIGWAPYGSLGIEVAPSLFVFVEERRFDERLRPATLIVNNPTIISTTRELKTIKRENRNFGAQSKRVVVNEGPGLDAVQKAAGKKIAKVSVAEVDRRTNERAPASLNKRNEAGEKNKSSVGQSEPKIESEQNKQKHASQAEAEAKKSKSSAQATSEQTERAKPSKKTAEQFEQPKSAPVTQERAEKERIEKKKPSKAKTTPEQSGPSSFQAPPERSERLAPSPQNAPGPQDYFRPPNQPGPAKAKNKRGDQEMERERERERGGGPQGGGRQEHSEGHGEGHDKGKH